MVRTDAADCLSVTLEHGDHFKAEAHTHYGTSADAELYRFVSTHELIRMVTQARVPNQLIQCATTTA